MEQMIREKLHKLIDAFTPILYEDDETFQLVIQAVQQG